MTKPETIGGEAIATGAPVEPAPAGSLPVVRGPRYETIEALRFLAALAVVVTHSSFYAAERLNSSLGIYKAGANGVRLFFVISGFVMIMSTTRIVGTPLGWRAFAVRRIVRIVPIYWAVNAIKLAILLITPGAVLHARLDWGFIAKSLFFIPAINVDGDMHPFLGVGWTLNFEMFFYLLFTVALLARARPILALAPVLVALALLHPIARQEHWPVPAQFLADPIVLDFLGGMLLARAVQGGMKLPAPVAVLLLLVGGFYLLGDVPRPGAFGTLQFSLAMTVASVAIVAGAVALDARLTPYLPRWMLFMGAASYSLYLIHPIVAPFPPTVLNRIGIHQPLLSIGCSIAVALIAGALSYRLVERPATAWLNGRARGLGLYATDRDAARRVHALAKAGTGD